MAAASGSVVTHDTKMLPTTRNGLERNRELRLLVHRPDVAGLLIGRDRVEEVVEFEEMAVDVDDSSVAGIGHGGAPPSRVHRYLRHDE